MLRCRSYSAPANIFVHVLTDGAVGALTPSGANFIAPNLRSAISHANDFAGSSTIILDTATYSLTAQVDLEIKYTPATSLTIKNATGGASQSTIDAHSLSRIFEVDAGGTTILDHLKLTNGKATSPQSHGADGGAIYINGGTVNLINSCLKSNTAQGSVSDGGTGGNGGTGTSGAVSSDAQGKPGGGGGAPKG